MSSPTFVFRCDGSSRIGMGHIIRCSALCMALNDRGCTVHFALRQLDGDAISFAEKAGIQVHLIPPEMINEESPLGLNDRKSFLDIGRTFQADCVLVDHYGASSSYLNALDKKGFVVAVIDDLAYRDLTAADWMLNQNLAAVKETFRVRPDCVKLLGTRYALLRPEFVQARRQYYRRFENTDNHVLITLGGGDNAELSREVVNILERVHRRLEIRCISRKTPSKLVGQQYPFQKSNHNIEFKNGTDEMEKEMLWADLSINAGGTTCWELLCLGVPMTVMALSEDQRSNAVLLDELGCAKKIIAESPQSLSSVVEELLAKPSLRAIMSERGRSLVDGQGAARAAKSLIHLVKEKRTQGSNAAH